MLPNRSIFLTDVPVSKVDENKLWGENSSVMQEVEEVASAILVEDGKLTFAVHGAWGAGKTSFLRMVENTVKEKMGGQEVIFCRYEASAYQGIGMPETTIALRIWSALGGEDPEKNRSPEASYDMLARYMQGILADEFGGLEGKGKVEPYVLLQILARKTGQLADFPRLLEDLLVAGGPDDLPKKLVLVVDDLDRCRSDFIGKVLDALQRFSSVKNLFILVGVDREVLLTAIKERYQEVMSVRDEHLALEKYIQYTVDLPELTPEVLTEYIQECLVLKESDEEIEKRVLEIIRENASYFVMGVRVRTPRAIKRSINAIHPALKWRLEQQPELSEREQQLIIKEQLLAYNWRHFYQRYFQAAQQDYNAEEFFQRLEQICQTSYPIDTEMTPEQQRDRRAIFELRLERIKTREFSENVKLEIPDELAKLLAQPPYWFLGRQERLLVGRTPDIVDQIAAMDIGGENLDEEFLKFYLQSEQADAIGEGRTSVEAAAQAFDLVRRNKHRFGKDVSPRLGNLGVNAEKYKVQELAEAIFRLALEIDEHSGVLQQFVSYILDNRSDLYEEAEAILRKLQVGQHATHDPWRTTQLLVQLRTVLGQEVEEDLIARMTRAVESEADVRQLGMILDALIRAGQYQLGVRLFGSSVERFPNRNSRYTLQRLVADALARRSEADSECLAMDLYRQILANPETMGPADEYNVMHNYATLLYQHDFDDEAGCLWFRAYQSPVGKMDSSIRRAYSLYLHRTEKQDLAQKVIAGETIDEMALIPTDKELPGRFSDIELPDALSESGSSSVFRCLESSADS
jgi:hypothetical protein